MQKMPPQKDVALKLLECHSQLENKLLEMFELNPFLRFKREILQIHDNCLLPSFCNYHSENISKKKILAILQDPGNSGAKNSKICSIKNNDPTAERQRSVGIERFGINPNVILFWNFYPNFGRKSINVKISPKEIVCQKIIFNGKLQHLAEFIKKLRAIIVCGNEVWEEMKFFKPIRDVQIHRVPHPFNRGMMPNKGMNKKVKCNMLINTWKLQRKRLMSKLISYPLKKSMCTMCVIGEQTNHKIGVA